MDSTLRKRATFNLVTFITTKFISTLGLSTYSFGISLYVLTLTGSATNFAINFLSSSLPRILLAPIAGYAADKYSKRIIVVLSQFASAAIVSFLLIASLMIDVPIPWIFITTALLSVTGLFNSVTFTSSITNLVDEKRIQKAISLNSSSETIARIIGPILGGVLYANFNLQIFLILFIICFIVTATSESTMNFKLYSTSKETHQPENRKNNMLSDIVSGYHYVKQNELIMCLLSISIIANFTFTSVNVGIPFILIDTLHFNSYQYGFTQASFSIGMVLTTLLLSLRKEVTYPFIVAKRSLIGLAILMTGMTFPLFINFSHHITFIYFIFWEFTLGISLVLMNTPLMVTFLKLISDEFKGRVFGLIDTLSSSLIPLGIILYGLLFDRLSPIIIMSITSVVMLFSALYLLRKKVIAIVHPEYYIKNENLHHLKNSEL